MVVSTDTAANPGTDGKPTAKPGGRRATVGEHLATFGPLVILAALIVLFTALNPTFLSIQNIRTLLDQSAGLLIVSMGVTMVILLGSIDLSVEGAMAVAAFVFVLLVPNDRNGNDFGLAAAAIAVLVGGVVGLANGTIITRLRIPSFMATLGMSFVALGMAAVIQGDTVPRLTDESMRQWAGGSVLGASYPFLIAVVVVVITLFISRYTKLGRSVYAVGGDESTALLSGLHVNRVKVLTFTFAGLCFGLAGVIASMRLGVGVIDVGSGLLFGSLSAVVVGGTLLSGGRGGVPRTVAGVFILTVLGNGLILAGVSPYIQGGVQGIVIVTAVAATGWRARARLRIVK